MSLRRFLCLSLAVAVLFVGCGKKKQEAAQPATPAAVDTAKDSSDVFEEFFQDDPKAAKKAEAQPASFSGFVEDGRYVVQVSCVGSQALAQSVVSTLEGKGWPAYVAEVENPTPELPGTYYRVRVGGFAGVSEAKSFGENTLVPAGYDFWVDNRSNDNVGISSYGLGSSAPASSDYSSSSTSSTTSSTASEGSSWGSSSSTTSSSSSSSGSDWGGSSSSSSSSGSGDWGGSSSTTTSTTTSSDWGSTSSGTSTTPAAEGTSSTSTSTTTTGTSTTTTAPASGSSSSSGGAAGGASSSGSSGGWGGDDWGSDW